MSIVSLVLTIQVHVAPATRNRVTFQMYNLLFKGTCSFSRGELGSFYCGGVYWDSFMRLTITIRQGFNCTMWRATLFLCINLCLCVGTWSSEGTSSAKDPLGSCHRGDGLVVKSKLLSFVGDIVCLAKLHFAFWQTNSWSYCLTWCCLAAGFWIREEMEIGSGKEGCNKSQ